jgi:LysR family transcriptional regulator for bpeEF and oprC
MPSFHQLQCMRSFAAVAQAGSFARAAHALQVGAASVSEPVATLERHLGVALFHRTTRSLQLTHEGVRYLALCRDILPRIEEMDTGLARTGRDEALSGLLRIEMSDGIDACLLDAIHAFQDRHPAVSIHLHRSQRPFDLAEAHADIAIRAIAPLGRTPSRTLGHSRTVFLAAPAYLERKGAPRRPEELTDHDCIGYVDPASGRMWEWYFAGADGRSFALDLPCALAFSQGDLRRRAALAGRGIINDIARFVVQPVRDGALVPILQDWSIQQPLCHVSVHRERHASPRITAFLAHLEQWLGTSDI